MTMKPVLPQLDPDPAARARALAEARETWLPSTSKLPGLTVTEAVPEASQPSVRWFVEAGRVAGRVVLNILANRRAAGQDGPLRFADDEAIDEEEEEAEALLEALEQLDAAEVDPEAELPVRFSGGPGGVKGMVQRVDAQVRGILSGAMDPGLSVFEENAALYAYRDAGEPRRARSLADFEALYRSFPLSPAAAGIQDDLAFAWRRLNGPNGAFLQRSDRPPEGMSVQDADLAAATGAGDALRAAGAEGRLFVADYSPLATALEPKDPSLEMYAYAPRALFAVPPGGGALRPVAVQIGPDGGHPVLTPRDGARWAMARTMVEVADMAFFEPVTHLAWTHLLLEAVALAMHRHLAPNHPLHLLLRPHVEGTISVNDSAVKHLLADGGAIDQTFGATMSSIRGVAARAIKGFHFVDDALPRRFVRHGLDDRGLLPDSPYRDDTLRIWGAIERWVRSYVFHSWPDEESLRGDTELSAWNRALLAAPDAGGLFGFPVLSSREALVQALTQIIHTASAGHAATNFPQWSDCSFPARMSGAGYTPGLPGTEDADLLKMLPPLSKAELHADFLYLLGALYHTRLGVYESNAWPYRAWFVDPKVKGELLPALQAELAKIEGEISALNADPSRRSRPYVHLLPSRIPQSINI